MRRSIPLLIVLLAVQLGLAGLLAVRRNPLASIPPQSPLLETGAADADHLLLEGSGSAAHVQIAKRNGQWVLPDYFNAPADKFKVEDLLTELADLRHGLPIATSNAALERFKLADDDFERRLTLSQGAHTLGTVYFGSSAGARRTDARSAADHAVYSVDMATYELPTQLNAWFANDLLEQQPEQIFGVDVMTPQSTVHLMRQAPAAAQSPSPQSAGATSPTAGWTSADVPHGERLEVAKADALARAIGDLRLQGVLGTSPEPEWQQDHPLLTLTLHEAHSAQRWVISEPNGGTYYVLKASSQPWYFSLDSSTGKQLLDAASPTSLIVDPAAQAKAAAAAAAAAARASAAAAAGTRPRTMIIHHLPHPANGTGGSTAPDVTH